MSYQDLSKEIDDAGGVCVKSMGQLRDVHGAGKLGSNVVASIAEKLAGVGLGHSPTDLPTSQFQRALIYRRGSAFARLIEAVNDPNEHSIEVLAEISGNSGGASETLQQIRDLVCG